MPDIYWAEIRQILSTGVSCMSARTVATPRGVFQVDLTSYETVKELHQVIAAAINAWERDDSGDWVDPPRKTKPHAMPPGRPLPVAQVDTFLTWVADGMPHDAMVV